MPASSQFGAARFLGCIFPTPGGYFLTHAAFTLQAEAQQVHRNNLRRGKLQRKLGKLQASFQALALAKMLLSNAIFTAAAQIVLEKALEGALLEAAEHKV